MVPPLEAISMEPVKQKLLNLHEFMPDADDVICNFAAYLAERLNSELVPQGFVMGAELTLYDLQKGVNGFTGQPIRSSLVGYPPVMYALLRMHVPTIAAAVCPPEFAQGVREVYAEVDAKMQKKASS